MGRSLWEHLPEASLEIRGSMHLLGPLLCADDPDVAAEAEALVHAVQRKEPVTSMDAVAHAAEMPEHSDVKNHHSVCSSHIVEEPSDSELAVENSSSSTHDGEEDTDPPGAYRLPFFVAEASQEQAAMLKANLDASCASAAKIIEEADI